MGWYAAMATLVNERANDGGLDNVGLPAGQGVSSIGGMGAAVELAKTTKRRGKSVWENDTFRQRISQLAIESTALQHSGTRAAARLAKGIPMADEVNITKLFRAEMEQRRADLMVEIIGTYAQLWRGGPRSVPGRNYSLLTSAMITSRSMTIYAGTSEINRNVIAERILGMPRQ